MSLGSQNWAGRGSPGYINVLKATYDNKSVPRAASPEVPCCNYKVLRAGSPEYKNVSRAGCPEVPCCTQGCMPPCTGGMQI